MLRILARAVVVIAASLLVVTEARAQSSLQVPLQFDFLNPGARSMALGGAFTGLADDATAAFTNPAGLIFLAAQEISVEGRGRWFQTPYLYGGRLSGTVTNTGVDTVNGPVFNESDDTGGNASFLSWVYPSRNQWAVAVYRHELARVEESFQTQGVFQRGVFAAGETDVRELPQTGSRELDITNYGFAAAFRAGDVSFGGGVSLYQFEMDSLFQRYLFDGFYGPANYNTPVARSAQHGDNLAVGANLGVLWSVNPMVRLGATYRQSPAFTYEMTEGTAAPREFEFRVPHVFSVGAMFRISDPLMVVADYTRVNYSRLVDDFVTSQAAAAGLEDQFYVDNGNEVHAGIEYVFTDAAVTPALRAGIWFDPAHSVQYMPRSNPDQLDERLSVALSQGEDMVHYTFGAGASLSRNFEINGAADISDRRQQFSVSAVVRF